MKLKKLFKRISAILFAALFMAGIPLTSLPPVQAYENEPGFKQEDDKLIYEFKNASELKDFSSFYGATWQELKVSAVPAEKYWNIQNGKLTRKLPVELLSDTTALYLNDYTFRYFEAEISFQFNEQNGLIGLVFNANELKGWGAYNTFAYVMSENPGNPVKGDMVMGLASEPAGIGLGQSEVNVNEAIGGRENKPDWHKMRVRVTKQCIEVYMDGGEKPVHVVNVMKEQGILEGRIGIQTVGADISFGGFTVRALDEQGNAKPLPEKKALVEGLDVTEKEITVHLGDFSKQIIPQFTPAEPYNQEVEYVPLDSSIVTVDEEGYLYPAGVGETVVSCISADGRFVAEVTVKVEKGEAPTSITLDKEEIETKVGERDFILTPSFLPETAYVDTYKWSSSNPAVAIINNGRVKIMGEGETLITVKVADTDLSATCKIIVKPADAVDEENSSESEKSSGIGWLPVVITSAVLLVIVLAVLFVILRKRKKGGSK